MDSDLDYETRTRTMNWPRFLLVESGDDALPVTKLSPFAIGKGFQALIPGRLRSIKQLRNGTFLVECDTHTQKQSDLLLKSQKLVDRPMKVSIHPTLNSSHGVIRCRDLARMTEMDIQDEWAEWHWSSMSGERTEVKKRTQLLCFWPFATRVCQRISAQDIWE